MHIRHALAGLVIASTSSALAALPSYHVTDLGDFGNNSTIPQAINSKGWVTGSSLDAGGTRPFIWKPVSDNATTGTITNLAPSTLIVRVGQGINAAGQIAIHRDFNSELWNPTSPGATAGTFTTVISAPTNSNFGDSINDYGQITHYHLTNSTTGEETAFLWTPTSANANTGTSVSLGAGSVAEKINSSGQVAGQASAFTGGVWTPTTPHGSTGSWSPIGTLPGDTQSAAYGINSSGQLAGFSFGASHTHAFLWTPNVSNGPTGAMIDLGDLPGGSDFSWANSVNDAGQVVGRSSANAATHGFVWTAGDGMLDLNDFLDASGASWVVGQAFDVNNAGQIVGVGVYDPDGPGGVAAANRGYLLTPVTPEPGSLVMLSCGAGGLLLRRGRRPAFIPAAASGCCPARS